MFLFPGVGMAAVYVSCQITVVQQFRPSHLALATLFLSLSANFGVMLFISCYHRFFYSDGNPGNQNVGRYFLTLAVVNIVLHILLCTVQCLQDRLTRKNSFGEPHSSKLSQLSDGNGFEAEKSSMGDCSVSLEESQKASVNQEICTMKLNIVERNQCGVRNILSSVEYHLVLWPSCAASALRIVCVSNLGVILTSFNINKYPDILLYISSVVSIILKIVLAVLLTTFAEERVPLVGILVFAKICLVLAFLLANFWLNNVWLLMLLITLWTVGGGFTSSVVPPILAQIYGREITTVAVGSVLAAHSIILFIFQSAFGMLYDKHIIPTGRTCYGYVCFKEFFMGGTVISIICASVVIIYAIFKKMNHR